MSKAMGMADLRKVHPPLLAEKSRKCHTIHALDCASHKGFLLRKEY
jgi:hypothetical protein